MGQPVVHFEIGCKDTQRISEFYCQLFGWQMQPAGIATLVDTGSKEGINGHILSLGHEPHHYILFYVEVEELTPYINQMEALGGTVTVPPVPLPDGRTFSWLTDPDGNTFGIITPKR